MATVLTKELLQETLETIQEVYMEDSIPWICGYSGGKDSSAVVQLVWMALAALPAEKRTKTVHIMGRPFVENTMTKLENMAPRKIPRLRNIKTIRISYSNSEILVCINLKA